MMRTRETGSEKKSVEMRKRRHQTRLTMISLRSQGVGVRKSDEMKKTRTRRRQPQSEVRKMLRHRTLMAKLIGRRKTKTRRHHLG